MLKAQGKIVYRGFLLVVSMLGEWWLLLLLKKRGMQNLWLTPWRLHVYNAHYSGGAWGGVCTSASSTTLNALTHANRWTHAQRACICQALGASVLLGSNRVVGRAEAQTDTRNSHARTYNINVHTRLSKHTCKTGVCAVHSGL